MDRLKGKRTLITGGTSGIGLAAAQRFLEEGARVAITGSDAGRLMAARTKLGEGVTAIEADSGRVEDQKTIADAVGAAFGGLDAVFINAGIVDIKPLAQWDERAFDRSFAINVKGPFFLIRELLPMLANPASIVLNGSINAHIGMANTSVYSATKAAVISLARTLSGELVGRGIRANVISAGPIATPLDSKLGRSAADIRDLVAQVPVGRQGSAKEFADAVVYFASDESAFTVGSELIVDGGMSTL